MSRYVIYIRVSTKKQGQSGLGLEAQKDTCMKYIESQNGVLSAVFQDVESGTSRERTGLQDALTYCKTHMCTLVIAKLDRLARDVEFTFKVINTGVQIYFCDMPMVNTMILGVFASVAQYERELISKRTKDGLAVRRKQIHEDGGFISRAGNRCTKLGSHSSISPEAIDAARVLRIEKAKKNPSNIFFGKFIEEYERHNGAIHRPYVFSLLSTLSESLNALGQKTPTGMGYTPSRVKAMLTKRESWIHSSL